MPSHQSTVSICQSFEIYVAAPFMSIIHCCEGGIFWYVHNNAVEIRLKLFCAADGSTGAVFLQWYVVRWERKQIEIFWYTPALPSKTFKSIFPHCWKIASRKKTLSSNVLFWTNTLKTKAILALELFHIRRWRRNRSKACRPWNLIYMDSAQIQARAKDTKYVILKSVNFKT